jgi:drug/metabolite transporter (DMT)-like permease
MGQIYILLAIFLWSSLGIVVRLAAVPVHVLTFYALVIAVILQGAFIVTKGYQREIRGVKDLRFPVVLGAISAVNSLTFFYAFTATTIANAVLTHYTAPVIVAFLAVVFLKERITPAVIVAIILASVGLWVMLDGLSIQSGQASGIAAGLVSGVAYALIVIIARQYGRQYRPIMLTFIVNVTIIMLLAPFIREFPVHALWSFLFMGIVHSTAAPVLYYRGLQEVSATRTAVLGYLEPVCAILLSMAFLHETPGMNSLFGGGLIVCSGYLTVRAGTREAS